MRRSPFSFQLPLLVLVALVLAGCGGSSGGGGGGSSKVAEQIAEILQLQPAEGLKSAPLNLGNLETEGLVQHPGTVATGGLTGVGDNADSYYLVQGITPGVEYTVTMANLTEDADVFLFQGDPTFETGPFTRLSTSTVTETFTIQAGQNVTSFFIAVDGFKTEKGAKYDLSVIVKPLSEGSQASPISLFSPPVSRPGSTVGNDPNCCGIDPSADSKDSFYQVDVAEDVLISISDMTDDVDLYVYGDPSFATPPLCISQRLGTAIETCQVLFTSSTLYVAVDGSYADQGAAYKINVITLPSGCGASTIPATIDTPCDLGAAPGLWDNSNVDSNRALAPLAGNGMTVLTGGDAGITIDGLEPSDSFYVVSTVVPGTKYRLALEDATDKVGLYVYDRDSSYHTPICQPPYPDKLVQECNFTASSTAVYVAVDGHDTAAGAAYSLSILPEFLAEGTAAAPKDLGNIGSGPILADLANIHTVLKDDDIGISGDKDSYYKVTGATVGKKYLVSIPGMTDDVDLYVFNGNATFATAECTPYLGGTAPEQCIVTATGTTLYFAVDGYFTLKGAAYLIEVKEVGTLGEGTTTIAGDNPKDLGGAPVDYSGFVVGTNNQVYPFLADATDSYYKVQVSPGRTYRFDLTGADQDLDLYVFSDSSFTVEVCESSFIGQHDETCLVTAAGPFLYVAVDGDFAALNSVASFNLHVEERAAPTPTALSVNAAPTTGVTINWASDSGIGGPNDKYYSATVTGGTTYRVRISNLTDDLDLYLFAGDADFLTSIDCPNTYLSGTEDEYCDYTPTADGTLYFAVDSYWMSAETGTYDISITTPP